MTDGDIVFFIVLVAALWGVVRFVRMVRGGDKDSCSSHCASCPLAKGCEDAREGENDDSARAGSAGGTPDQ